MSRYRYKEAFFTSPKLGDRMIGVKRLSDAIAILNSIGDGTITVEARPEYGDPRPARTNIPIRHLQGKNEEAVLWLFDSQIDVSRARDRLPKTGRQIDPANRGRWPLCPQDIRNILDGILPDPMYRLRHFGALMVLKIKIGDHFFAVPDYQRAMIDAGIVDDIEKTIVMNTIYHVGYWDLLYLK